jgi:excinuclease ABC subunit C
MFDPAKLSLYPTDPGCYLMKSRDGTVLYVGKANNLRARLRQYWGEVDSREMIPYLLEQVDQVETIVVGSEKEALLLEETLIKRHLPKYNVLLKDDRTYIGLRITAEDEWPRVELVRFRGAPKEKGTIFGPYPHASAARETLELLRRLFPLRQCSNEELARRTRPCLLYQIKRCVAPCTNLCSKEEYGQMVESVEQFLRGRDTEVVELLRKEIEAASQALEYERAAQLLKTLRQVEMTVEAQRVVTDRPLSCDAIGIYREGPEVVITVLIFRDGRLIGSERDSLSGVGEPDPDLLRRFLMHRYQSGAQLPREILLPLELEERPILEELFNISIQRPVRGSKRQLVEMAEENSKAAWKQTRDRRTLREQQLLELQERCQLNNYPQRIECIDTSHLQGTDAVAVVIAFYEGEKETRRYRTYKLREAQPGDDYGALREVLLRRYGKNREDLPDLLVLDGGKGQLSTAIQVFQELNIISVDLMALAKEAGRHDRGITAEQIFLRDQTEPLRLDVHSGLLFLLQQIRDEAHRFALTFHRKRRTKSRLTSALDQIPGIGPVKRTRLLRHFGSVKRIQEATDAQLLQVQGITERDVDAINRWRKR